MIEVAEASAPGLELSPEPLWPHWQLKSEEGRARVKALCEALGFTPDFAAHDLGLPATVDWRFAGPGRLALLYGGRVAFETTPSPFS